MKDFKIYIKILKNYREILKNYEEFLPRNNRKIAYLVIYGTCKDASYNSVAIFGTAPIFLQSINQNLAETVVVNDTLSFMKVNGVDPVTSSHCDSLVPPKVK